MSVYGFGCSPIYENSISLVLSDGRTLIWDVKTIDDDEEDDEDSDDLASANGFPYSSNVPSPPLTLRDQMRRSSAAAEEGGRRPRLHMLLTGLHPTLTSPISPGAAGAAAGTRGVCVLKMCPPLTTKVGMGIFRAPFDRRLFDSSLLRLCLHSFIHSFIYLSIHS